MSTLSPRFRFPKAVFTRIIFVQLILVLAALLTAGLFARHFFQRQHLLQVERQVLDTLTVLSRNLPSEVPARWCRDGAAGTTMRFTLVDASGRVLCDSHHEAGEMENHANRPEIRAALQGGYGEVSRYSSTLQEDMFYGALATADRSRVIRIAVPLSILTSALRVFDSALAIVLAGIAIILSLASAWAGRKLLFPLGRVLLKAESVLAAAAEPASRKALAPMAEDQEGAGRESYGEWSELETSLETIRKDLALKAERLSVEREELATLMSAISDAILAVDLEGRPLFFNTNFALSFGSEEGLAKRSVAIWEIFRAPEIIDAFNAALKEGRSASVKAIPIEKEMGAKRFFSLSVSPLRRSSPSPSPSPNSEVYGAVGVFHDVTELKSAEQIRIDFVANVSHELRTPLTSIKGYTDTLKQDLEEGRPVEKSFLEIISRNVERLMSLISDLLDLSSLESTDVLHKAPIGTAEVTERILRQLQASIQGKRHVVKVSCEATVVTADPRRLEQVLVNLLDNANKYTPPGSAIHVAWEYGGEDVLLRVKDNGPGIPREHQSRLFERFFRVDKARSREQGGTGLGLAIVKHIMQKHGGSVWVESEVGVGTTFVCRFPA